MAESMRNCAQLAETFAKIVADAEYSQETAALVAGVFVSRAAVNASELWLS